MWVEEEEEEALREVIFGKRVAFESKELENGEGFVS